MSLISAIFVGAAAGYLGSLMVTKRMALVGDALGHVALPGMGLALLWGFNVSLGAFVFLLIGILLIWFLENKTNLPTETLVGVVFVFSLAIGFLITPEPELLEALMGDISEISLINMLAVVVLSLVIIEITRRIYLHLIISSISEDLAAANKINRKMYNLIYLMTTALVVALGVKMVGSLLVGALVVVPAAASRNISRNIHQYSYLASLLGILSAILGFAIYQLTHFSIGPLIILASVYLFVVSLFWKRRNGG